MTKVKVTFSYEPTDPDEDDPTGMSEEEYDELADRLMEFYGADDLTVEKVAK